MEVMLMSKMTWKEMCEKYPNQTICISDIDWDNGSTIQAGNVKYSESDGYTKRELTSMALRSNGTLHCRGTNTQKAFVGIAR